jgi:glycosyltransferase involved in cell wall biosynthesis
MSRTVALDCRWLAYTGAGRVVELLLRGFAERPPTGHWVLWGPSDIEQFRWSDSDLVLSRDLPNTWRGQRDWFRVPSSDLVVFMHQQRPLRPLPALTMILDTTPIQFAASRLDRAVKAQFLRRAAAMSSGILTISEFSRRAIEDDLGVPSDKIEILDLPADERLAARVLAARSQARQEDVALYLGLFLPHKNLPRLVEAFGRTTFRRDGGRLLLVGGKGAAAALHDSLTEDQRGYVEIRPRCSQSEIEHLLASCRFLVQPSLVEGFGLPVWEALASGLPVCVSDGGALPEITRGLAETFPARSVEAMAAAVDACAARASAMGPGDDARLSARLLAQAPTVADFAVQFDGVVQRHLDAAAHHGSR